VTGFDFKRIRTRQDEVSTSKDDLRVLRFGTDLLEQDRQGQGLLVQELRLGIPNLLGGSHPEETAASRSKAGGSFLKWTLGWVRVQRGPWNSSFILRGSTQVTTDRLVPAEQFRLGGFETVRGYPEGEFLADSGYQTAVEWRVPVHRPIPLTLLTFWDFAEGFLRDPSSAEDADMRLSGVGFGLRLRPTAESILQADLGWAIGDRDREKDRPRLHLVCRVGF
jgi:hemolysin activation/secretion protein